MEHYADSSFLVSYFGSDANSAIAQQTLAGLGVALPFTGLHRLEIRNAFELQVFRGEITTVQAAASWSRIQGALRSRQLVPFTMRWAPAFRLAFKLAATHSSSLGTRALDILHVAAAVRHRGRVILSFDGRQRQLAAAQGMTVLP